MKLFKQTLKASAIGAVTAALAFGVIDAKAEDAGTNITAQVTNTFTWVETQALDFGEFIAVNHGTDVSTITIDPTTGAPTYANTGAARITEITAGDRGIFDATNAAPSALMTLTLPTTVTLTCGTCPAGTEDFTVGNFVSDPTGAGLTTDATGALTVGVGARLTTIASANSYEDGAYSGTYTVSLNY